MLLHLLTRVHVYQFPSLSRQTMEEQKVQMRWSWQAPGRTYGYQQRLQLRMRRGG